MGMTGLRRLTNSTTSRSVPPGSRLRTTWRTEGTTPVYRLLAFGFDEVIRTFDGSVRRLRCSVRIDGFRVDRGVLVTEVEDGGPADEAGLEKGDLIVAYGSAPVSTIDDLHRVLTEKEVGRRALITVFRNGGRVEISVVPGETPEA